MNSNNIPINMSVAEAASYLRYSKTWLDKIRVAGGGLLMCSIAPLGGLFIAGQTWMNGYFRTLAVPRVKLR